ncbi:MAG: nucleotidyltransferase domain-containing protein [Rhizobiales bacterium]|jgi:predicted nucleotidyltransferase|nr:nucleotidyltransferase domain-containing protein [Hyphomicrobiales bacterium]
MNRPAIIEAIRSQEKALRAEGVEHLALFGSRARDDANPDSDLDVLIDVVAGKRFSLLHLSGVGLLIEDATGLKSQVVMRRAMPATFAARIASDLVPVF